MFTNHVSARLYAYRENRLPDRQRQAVEAHLATCERCRGELAGIGNVAELLSGLPAVPAPPSTWANIEAALEKPARAWAVPRWRWAAALVLLLAAGVGWWQYRQSRPGWAVAVEGRGESVLRVREWLDTGASRARIKVGRIGEVEVEPNTRIRLLDARPGDHRLALARGTMHATIWAPPRLFFVETPAGRAVDLGCVYTLTVDARGAGLLRVTIGWVMLEDKGREALAPAGAACRMRPGAGPGTPYFEDSSPRLQTALESFDFEGGGAAAISTVMAEARPRDSLSLWHLLSRAAEGQRGALYDRMASLVPPPPDVTREAVLRLERPALETYKNKLEWAW